MMVLIKDIAPNPVQALIQISHESALDGGMKFSKVLK